MAKGFLLGIIVTLIAIAVGGYLGLTRGVIPSNADAEPGPFERFSAGTALRAVLRNEAPKGSNPVAMTDAGLIEGIQLYAKHCTLCHGTAAGNASTTPIAKGEYPKPPQLATEGVEDDPEGWTFWKIKHGIRWTGMPSWKDELNDQQIWTLALFLKHMDHLPPGPKAVWQQLTRPASTAGTRAGLAH